MKIGVVAAVSENGVIGRSGALPWRLPDDQRHFQRLTQGHCVVMGRKTFDAIGRKPLPRRTNIVITRDPDYAATGALVARSFEAALEIARRNGEEEVFVAGGSDIYAAALPCADRLHLTRVHAEIEGDAFFPDFDQNAWKLVAEDRHEADSRNEHAFTIQEWERR